MNVDVEQIVREHIDKTVHMSLATVSDNKPWVSEIHFAYDDDLSLYFVSKQNTRHCQEIANNPAVAGNIVRQHELSEYPGAIYFEGAAEVLENPTELQIESYCKRLRRDVAQVTAQVQRDSESRMYIISVNNWACFGKFDDSNKGKKHELVWNGGKK